MKKQIKEAVGALCSAERIALACHVNPDGDALGSILALTHVLRGLGKTAMPLSADGVPDIYGWMPGAEWVRQGTDQRDFDLAVVCDSGALDRVGKRVMAVIETASVVIDIDHHATEGVFGDIQIIDATAAATAELVWKVIRALSVEIGRPLADRAVADCLMAGIITDTGSFRFLNVTPHTFDLAARLQRLGAQPAEIAELVFENRSFASLKLLGRALASLQTTPDGRIAWAHVTAADYAQLNADDAETEGIVSHVRSVKGAQVGILFREVPGRNIRISLRSRDGVDVSKVAAAFDGGGHKLAAGCSLDAPLAEAEKIVLAEMQRQMA